MCLAHDTTITYWPDSTTSRLLALLRQSVCSKKLAAIFKIKVINRLNFYLVALGAVNRPIPHKLIDWANYFLLKCWGKNHDVMLPFKHCFNGKSVQF